MKLKIIATGSSGNSALIWQDEKAILLDMGVPFQRIKEATGYQLERIQFGICTHQNHSDHGKALSDVLKAGIDVIKPPLDEFEQKPGKYNMGDYLIKAWKVEHDCINWAYLIYHKPTNHRICFMTDTSFSPLVPLKVDTLIMEISYCDAILESKQNELKDRYLRLKQYHMGLNRAKEFLAKMMESPGYQLKNIVITHLSDSNSSSEQIKTEIFELTGIMPVIAKKGLMVELI